MSKPCKDYNVLTWVFFASKGITDMADLMRANMLCMEIVKEGATIESVKKSTGYLSCIHDLPYILISDIKIQEMIDFEI